MCVESHRSSKLRLLLVIGYKTARSVAQTGCDVKRVERSAREVTVSAQKPNGLVEHALAHLEAPRRSGQVTLRSPKHALGLLSI